MTDHKTPGIETPAESAAFTTAAQPVGFTLGPYRLDTPGADALPLPGDPAGWHRRGMALLNQNRAAEATAAFRAALAGGAENAAWHQDLAAALLLIGSRAEAVAVLRRAVALPSATPGMRELVGMLLLQDGAFSEAAEHLDHATQLAPRQAGTHVLLGQALKNLGRADAAVVCYRRALTLDPHCGGAQLALGEALRAMNQLDAAGEAFVHATRDNPSDAQAYRGLGLIRLRQRRLAEAIAALRAARAADPAHQLATTELSWALRDACDWQEIAALEPGLDAMILAAEARGVPPTETPYMNVLRSDDPAQNLTVARLHAAAIERRVAGLALPTPDRPRQAQGHRLRIGYLSMDFHDHPLGHPTASLFGLHDRSSFEIFAYSTGPDDGSVYRQRIAAGVDSFVDLGGKSALAVAQAIRADAIDILVDLAGQHRGEPIEACALRPAPLQAIYPGFPSTSGARFIDYVIADQIVAPAADAGFFSEQIVRLPHSYQVSDHEQPIAATAWRRADMGLPEHGLVFCCFNKPLKLDPVIFAAWMRLLGAVPDSVLWLFAREEEARTNLRAAAAAVDIATERLVFAARLPKPEHLARLRLADLFLDTRIYGAHTTASDALWAGVPVITLAGGHFASRVGASLVTAIGLPELVTYSLADYEALALNLALDEAARTRLRAKLAAARRTAPLFDTPRFTRDIERAYGMMWQRYASGAPPQALDVPAED